MRSWLSRRQIECVRHCLRAPLLQPDALAVEFVRGIVVEHAVDDADRRLRGVPQKHRIGVDNNPRMVDGVPDCPTEVFLVAGDE